MERWILLNVFVIAATGCTLYEDASSSSTEPSPDAGVDGGGGPTSPLALPLTPPAPAENPTSPAKIALGRLLFWDPILSGDGDVACATCHHPQFGYADGLRTSIGTGGRGIGPARTIDPALPRPIRNSMTILDAAWNGAVVGHELPVPELAPMFWDNRTHSLEEQARGPLTTAAEMMGSAYTDATILPELVARLQALPDYVARFEAVYGPDAITETNILRSIAAFERSLTTPRGSYDRYLDGEMTALTPPQRRGLEIFNQIGCPKCHSGPMLSDFKLHDLRVPEPPGVPHDPGDGTGRFRTASLRNITLTAPYMHSGVLGSLEQVFGFYRQATQNPIDPDLRGVRPPTPQEAPDVIAFLRALGDAPFDATIPASVPSGLPPGGE